MKTEVTNQYGIMEKSILTITVIEARNVKVSDFDSQADLYVLIECASQSAQTKHLEGMQNPVWDETFQFEIYNGKEEIKICIMDKKLMKQDSIIGVLYIPLNTLKDQVKIEDWYSLDSPYDGEGKPNGRIRLQLWWIHSKTKLIEDRIMQTEEDIDKILEDKKYYLDKVKQLREPFGWMEATAMVNQSPSRQSNSFNNSFTRTNNQGFNYNLKENFDDDIEITKSHALLGAVSKIRDREVTWSRLLEEYSDKLSQQVGISTTPWYRVMQCVKAVYLVLTLLCCFLKPDFINLTICGLIFYCLAFAQRTRRWMFRLIAISIILSIFIDIIWMIFFTSSWWSRAPYDGDIELGLRRFIVIVSYLLFLVKIVVFLVFWKISVDFDRLFKSNHEQSETSGVIVGR